jgi:hypothetical protein
MTEKIVPIITEVGKIWGRDAIFLDKVNVIDECTFELVGQFNGTLCSNLKGTGYRNYEIIFKHVHFFKMVEFDFDEIEYQSSFDIIENSKQILKMLKEDKTNGIGKIDNTYQHYVFRTYDTVFEIIGKSFQFTVK